MRLDSDLRIIETRGWTNILLLKLRAVYIGFGDPGVQMLPGFYITGALARRSRFEGNGSMNYLKGPLGLYIGEERENITKLSWRG